MKIWTGVGRNKKRLLGKKPKWWRGEWRGGKGRPAAAMAKQADAPIFSSLYYANYANASQMCGEY
jgi:hypothetical protein